MNKRDKIRIATISVLLLLICISKAQVQPARDYVKNQIIIKFRENTQKTDIVSLKTTVAATVVSKFAAIDAELWSLSDVSVEDAISQYRNDPRVEYVEPNYIVSMIATFPSDPGLSQLWGLNNDGQTGGITDADIDATEAWDIQTGGDVIIGVIDTGVDWNHEDLADNIWVNPGEIPNNGIDDDGNGYVDDVRGWDFINDDNDPMDDNGHGTHVAGTIAAVGDNGIGVVGVCWRAKIMPLKFLGSGGSGSVADAIRAIEYATRMGAKLTSNSWGGTEISQSLFDAIAASNNADMLFVAASGNDGTDNDTFFHYPSNFNLDNIIAVAATTHNDTKSSFSNFGLNTVDLGAPGSNIYSTLPDNRYGALSGTSMATPHVSGVAALVWSQNPGLTNAQVKERIMKSVDAIPALQNTTVSGGRLNAFNALAGPDSLAPAAVTDLSTTAATSNSITLTWTASGDDAASGTAAAYDIRYSLSPITANNFTSANEISGEPEPQVAGANEAFTVTGLDFSTLYYFALQVIDDWGNASPVSNSVSGTTLGAPEISVTPNSISETLSSGATSSQELTISNTGDGTLNFDILINRAENSSTSVSATEKREAEWILSILKANAQAAANLAFPVAETNGTNSGVLAKRMTVDEIFSKRQSPSSAQQPVLAMVLDGVGTVSANLLVWDELNAAWSDYGTTEILIDYSTFNGAEITYQKLVEGGADVLIVSDNWNPTHAYGPFSTAEATAIAQYVEEGAGLYISAGTFNNGEFPELQRQVEVLAPLVGLDGSGTYFWNGNSYGALNFEVSAHPILRDISEPFISGWQDKTLAPAGGAWTSGEITTGTLVGISTNRQTALIVNGNRVFHAGLPEHSSATNADKQFLYNVITQVGGRPSWLSVAPLQATVVAGNSMPLTVTFNATELQAGDYQANIVINSNDPDDSPVNVAVALTVSNDGEPTELELTWCEPRLSGNAGSRDTVYVCANDLTNQNILSYQMVITYDETVLDAVGAVSVGTISEDFGQPTVNTNETGEMTVGGFGTQPLSGAGNLVGLVFNVVGNAGATSEICLSSAKFNSGDPAVTLPDPCSTFEIVNSNFFSISGNVTYAITTAPLADVTMTLSGAASATVTTDAAGQYIFDSLQGGANYTITPSKAGEVGSPAITCFDGALAAQQAVGLITLTPEQLTAADVDEDGFVFTFDAAMICRSAIGLPPLNENEQTGQWRFEPRSRSYTPLNSIQREQGHAAILLGDVDGNLTTATSKAVAYSNQINHSESLSAKRKDIIDVPLNVDDSTPILAADIELHYDSEILRFVEVAKTDLSRNFEMASNSESGRLRVGLFGSEAVSKAGSLVFFRFEIIGRIGEKSSISFPQLLINGQPVQIEPIEVAVKSTEPEFPAQFALNQNYPNPFNPTTIIRFDIPKIRSEKVSTQLAIYNSSGQLIKTLLNEQRASGSYQIEWDGRDYTGQQVSSGIYAYRLQAGDFSAVKKMIFLK